MESCSCPHQDDRQYLACKPVSVEILLVTDRLLEMDMKKYVAFKAIKCTQLLRSPIVGASSPILVNECSNDNLTKYPFLKDIAGPRTTYLTPTGKKEVI